MKRKAFGRQTLRHVGHSRYGRRSALWATVGVVCVAAAGGCTRQKEEIPTTDVKPVTAYGVTLDADASPQQVAYVLLRSLKDDVTSAQAGQREAQKAAEKVTFSLAAPTRIEERVLRTLRKLQPGMNDTAAREKRDHRLYEIIHYWAPIVGHYIASFDETPEAAAARMWVTMDPSRTNAHVYYPVSHDPAETDPAEAETATLEIEMGKEKAAGQEYWRVVRLSYLGRLIKKATPGLIVESYGLTLDGSATPQQTAYVVARSLAEAARAKANEHKDLFVSSISRALTLAAPSVMADPADEAAGSGPQGTPLAITRWFLQVQPVADRIDADTAEALARMEVAPAGDATTTAVVRYALPAVASTDSGGDAILVIELAAQKSGDLSLWRVVSVQREGGPPAAEPPATQPATVPVTTS